MNDVPIGNLFALLAILIVLSGCFSSSETALMTLNRYRLRYLADKKHRGAMLAHRLLQRPDRLIGLILLGNNAVNLSASALATVIGYRLYEDAGIAAATVFLTIVILIFAEVAPKTVAVLYPERVAFPAAFALTPLMKILAFLVIAINFISNGLLKLVGISHQSSNNETLSQEELRTVVLEAGARIPDAHQQMLLSILDLEKATVEDIMIPRNDIHGIDLNDDWEDIIEQITHSQHTRLPVYRDNVDNILGFLHLRKVLRLIESRTLAEEELLGDLREPYFIPENTTLNKQLLNFQKEKRRVALAVDEYGDIQGLVALEDILEEIVGEFTTDPSVIHDDIFPQADGSYLVNATISIRELARVLNWNLPTDGPRTLNGLILEHMEDIPASGTSIRLGDYAIEILQTRQHTVKTARLHRTEPSHDDAS